jgi:radical SAM protein with 4Fe4S-binding SPASM domain
MKVVGDGVSFLRLNPECRLVWGAANACLYDTLAGDMHSLYRLESEFLAQAQGDTPLEELLARAGEEDRARLREFLAQIGEKDLARQYDFPYHVRPLERGLGGGLLAFLQPTRLQVFFLEITRNCGLACLFCRPGDIAGRGTGCGRHDDRTGESLSSPRRKALLVQAADLGAVELQLSGGDALEAPDWEDLVATALELGLQQITVWTTGLSPIPDRWLGHPRVKFALQVFSAVERVHDELAGRGGAFGALTRTLKRLKECNSDPALSLIVTRLNEDDYPRAQAFYQSFTRVPVRVAPLFPTGDGRLTPVGPGAALLGVRRWFGRVDLRGLSLLGSFHPCFAGKLAVTIDGRYLPCGAGRAWTIGNARHEDISALLSAGRHKPYWELTKARLPKCSRCEFRLGCFDCRVIQGNGRSLSEVHHCDYDPARGVWPEETHT